MVLAEYAAETSTLAEDLNRLGQAFNALKDKGLDIPAALLVNKWDRHPAMANSERSMEAQISALGDFFGREPAPPHCRLRDQIKNATGERFRVFPVSAFGKSRLEKVETGNGGSGLQEVPVFQDGQLESFGLEEALLWLVQQVEKAALERVQQAEEETRPLFPNPIKKRRAALLAGRRELRRFAPRGSARATLSGLVRKLEKSVRRRVAVGIACVSFVFLALLLISDEYQFQRQAAVIDSSGSGYTQLQDAENRLSPMAEPGFRYWVMRLYRIGRKIDPLSAAAFGG